MLVDRRACKHRSCYVMEAEYLVFKDSVGYLQHCEVR